MSEDRDKNMSRAEVRTETREERLAAKLRENLRRRKAQARQISESGSEALPNERDDS